LLPGAPRNLTAATGAQFNIMNVSAERNRTKRQRVSQIRSDINARSNRGSYSQSIRRKNIAHLAVRIFNQSNARRAIRVVLDAEDFCRHTVLASFEINLAVFLLVTAANVARGKPAVAVATAAFFLRLNKTPFRSPLCDFIKSWQRLETKRRRQGAEFFKCHNNPGFRSLLVR